MSTLNGISSTKTLSKSSASSWNLAWWEVALLLGCGALVEVLHQGLRIPLSLAGRHGLEWMALLVIGRSFSRFRGAGAMVGFGAAATTMLPMFGGFNDPTRWVTYLLPGLVADLVFWLWPRWTDKIWFLGLLGAVAHATKPIFRWLVALSTGYVENSLRAGLLAPLSTHLLFGLAGGLIGAILVYGLNRLSSKKHES